MEDAIQAMTCNMYYADVQMYKYIPSSTYPVNSACSNLSVNGRLNISMQNGRLAQLGTQSLKMTAVDLKSAK